ncbi:MAG TPA: class D sortase [Candidatus Sulfomarinibacteraceae bacterium]|nr:class D sortase [Candidatus Sulfomarinibacteraceae bacterium]
MRERKSAGDLSVEELEQLLYLKKQALRQERLQRLKGEGRLVDVAGLPPPNPTPPSLERPRARPGGALRRYALQSVDDEAQDEEPAKEKRSIAWRWVANKLLLAVEIAAILGFIWAMASLWDTRRELNLELAQVQRSEAAANALPTPTATPVIDLVVLPGGHKPPVDGRAPQPGEAGYIPAHLLPAVNAYEPPPIPTPGPEQARRIQIEAIGVDSSVYQGQDWEQLKKGVGQYIGSGPPGRPGNLVLAAHNDIYGEIFRDLDQLERGDEIVISSERQTYTYVVRETIVVEPTETWVMEPTDHASVTLISCYPYLVDNKRIVVFADLASEA